VANSVPELKPMPKVASAPVKPKPRTALVRFDNSSVPLQLVEIEDGVPDELANKTAIAAALSKLGIWSAPVGPTVEWIG
jgi:hypothetical protein